MSVASPPSQKCAGISIAHSLREGVDWVILFLNARQLLLQTGLRNSSQCLQSGNTKVEVMTEIIISLSDTSHVR